MRYKRTKVRDGWRWCVYLGKIGGKRRRKYVKSFRAAKNLARDAEAQRRTAGEVWVGMSDAERLEVVGILAQVRERGLTLTDVWRGFLDGTGRPPTVAPLTLREAMELTLKAKEAENCRPRYVKAMGKYLRAFARGREEMAVGDVTLATIQEWFAARQETPKRTVGSIGVLSSMFSVCVDHGFLQANPCHKFKRPRIDYGRPPVLLPEQVRKAVDHVHQFFPRHLGWFVLATFAGVRPEEIAKLDWSAFDDAAGTVTLDAEQSKVRERRIVHLEPAALAWVREAKRIACPLEWTERQKAPVRAALVGLLELKAWPQDVLRHTAASHWLALRRDAAAVALELGTSVEILMRHYRELVPDAQAAAFWAVLPRLRLP